MAMFEFTTWPASFTDFIIKLRYYTAEGKQLLISNDKNRVRYAVPDLSQGGVYTNLFENVREYSLKRDLSNDTPVSPPLFSLVYIFTVPSPSSVAGSSVSSAIVSKGESRNLRFSTILSRVLSQGSFHH
jgi:hypothetical protein